MAGDRAPLLRVSVASRALQGEAESGDFYVAVKTDTGMVVAVIDGLGHGVEAAAAARVAVRKVETSRDEPLPTLMRHCHEALVGTRGAVMSIASFDAASRNMTWVGVGNVAGVLFHVEDDGRITRSALIAPGGIVGRELPALRAQTLPVGPGDTIILATDGISTGFVDQPPDAGPQQMADRILTAFGKGTDDALVLVARYEQAAGAVA